ncbi:MAG: hypothetical protein K1X94_04255 [Sandaracinaceae bacterium]|nr:hypothetical protein [Sandaracinaceae bacterium]
MIALVALIALLAPVGGCSGCEGQDHGSAGPPEVDLTSLRAGFRCGRAEADADACAAIDAFEHAGTVTDWPAIGAEHRFIGRDHCVEPTGAAGAAAYQIVYLLRDPVATGPLPYRAAFASMQLGDSAPARDRDAIAALARGEAAPAALTPEALQTYWPVSSADIFRPLAHSSSGVSVSDDPPIWYLRADGDRLLLVSASIQGGCASELHRVR